MITTKKDFTLQKFIEHSNLKDFTQQEFIVHPDLEDNLDFYLKKFHSDHVEFINMNEEQKQNFKKIVKEYYYNFLDLTDEIINHEDYGKLILQQLSVFLRNQDKIIYFSYLAKEIVNANRDKDNPNILKLDKCIRSRNDNFIAAIDKESNLYISSIKAFIYAYHSDFKSSYSCKPTF